MNEQLTPDKLKQLNDLVEQGVFPSVEAAVDFSVELVDQLHFMAEKEAVEQGIADANAGRFADESLTGLIERKKQEYGVT